MAVDIEEVAQLLSRLEVNFSNILGNYFDIFYSDVAQDVTLEYYDEEGILQTIQVPNKTKYFTNIQSGNGSPEGNKTGNIGATYQDLENGKFYIKQTSFEITEGWKELATVDDMNNLIIKASGIPEGYNTAPMGTIYVNLLDGSVWVKQTASGNTGWVKIFSDDFATRQLDNLDEYGLDKLKTSNMYITGETQTADTIGYEQLEWMYHSTLDVSKFTTEGQPVINNDGSVTKLDYGEATPGAGEQENYVLIPNSFFDVGDNPWRLEWAGIMNHQSTSVSYMLGNDSTRENINSFINVYRGVSSNNLYFNLATNTGGASGTASNVNIEGTLVDTDRVLSGFSNVNYANLSDTFAPQTQNWEFNTYITTGTDITTKQTIVGSSNKQYSPFKIEISGGKFVLSVSLTDEELIGTVTGSDSLEVETGYYIRLIYNSAQYVLSFKKNISDNWVDTATISSTNKVYSSANPQAILSLGVQYSNSTIIYPFFGSIDLTKSNIIIANSNTWTGTYRTGTPTFSDTIFVTFDPIYEGKEFRAYINYEGLSTNKYTFAIRFKNDDNTWTDWLIKNTTLSGRTLDIGESNLPFGYRYGWDETLKLNYLKIYVNEGSGLEPRNSLNKVGVDTLTNGKSVQYVESITGSKVVNVFYKDIVTENYEIEGVSEYYVIDEIAREVYLPMGELYGMIFRKPSKVDIPERTSQLINDSGFITSNLVYCVENGNSNANGILDIVDYTPSQGGSAPQDVKLVYGPGTYTLPLNFESTTNCTVEAISGGAGGRVFDGIIVGYRATFFYKSGASGAYFKGNINLNAGNYEIVVGSGGVGQLNGIGISGGSSSFGLSGGTNYLSISGGYCGGSWLDVGRPGTVGSYTGFIGNPRILNGSNGGWLITQDYTYSSTGWIPIPNIDNSELGNPGLSNYGKGGRSLAPYYPYVADKGNYMRGTDGYFSISYTIPASQGKVGYVNYKVSPENPLTIIKKNGTKATITSINTDLLDNLELGLYNKFVDETGSELLKNTIYSQRPEPTNPQNNDVWVKFGEPLEVYKYVNGDWVEYNKVPIASFIVTIVDEVGTKGIQEGSIINAKFFDNKFLLNASNCPYIIESIDSGTSHCEVWSNDWCVQSGLTTSGGTIPLSKEYKDNNYITILGDEGGVTNQSSKVSNKLSNSFNIIKGTDVTRVSWQTEGYLKNS